MLSYDLSSIKNVAAYSNTISSVFNSKYVEQSGDLATSLYFDLGFMCIFVGMILFLYDLLLNI